MMFALHGPAMPQFSARGAPSQGPAALSAGFFSSVSLPLLIDGRPPAVSIDL